MHKSKTQRGETILKSKTTKNKKQTKAVTQQQALRGNDPDVDKLKTHHCRKITGLSSGNEPFIQAVQDQWMFHKNCHASIIKFGSGISCTLFDQQMESIWCLVFQTYVHIYEMMHYNYLQYLYLSECCPHLYPQGYMAHCLSNPKRELTQRVLVSVSGYK